MQEMWVFSCMEDPGRHTGPPILFRCNAPRRSGMVTGWTPHETKGQHDPV